MKKYFVAFSYTALTRSGVGNLEVEIEAEKIDMIIIREWEKWIQERIDVTDIQSLVITYFTEIGDGE